MHAGLAGRTPSYSLLSNYDVKLLDGSLCTRPLTPEEKFALVFFNEYAPRGLHLGLPPVNALDIELKRSTLFVGAFFPFLFIPLLYLGMGFSDLIISSSFLAKFGIFFAYLIGSVFLLIPYFLFSGVIATNFFRIKDGCKLFLGSAIDSLGNDFSKDLNRLSSVISNLGNSYHHILTKFSSLYPTAYSQVPDFNRIKNLFSAPDVESMLNSQLQKAKLVVCNDGMLSKNMPEHLKFYKAFVKKRIFSFIFVQVGISVGLLVSQIIAVSVFKINGSNALWGAVSLICILLIGQLIWFVIETLPSHQSIIIDQHVTEIAQTADKYLEQYLNEQYETAFVQHVRKARVEIEKAIFVQLPEMRARMPPGAVSTASLPPQAFVVVSIGAAFNSSNSFDKTISYYPPPAPLPLNDKITNKSPIGSIELGTMARNQNAEYQPLLASSNPPLITTQGSFTSFNAVNHNGGGVSAGQYSIPSAAETYFHSHPSVSPLHSQPIITNQQQQPIYYYGQPNQPNQSQGSFYYYYDTNSQQSPYQQSVQGLQPQQQTFYYYEPTNNTLT